MLRNLFIFSVVLALASCGGGSSAIKNTNGSGNSVVGSSAVSSVKASVSSAAQASASSVEV